ncbi:unnamed protein product [Rotaria sp. Silwood1]|nr:unnamed protein product [Rotaria sp. Silwood1]CAF4877409.1 unnamed protein product [Rotaria sp. Silwood1]
MRDFIVDDDNDESDYERELQETLKKNFGFDKNKYHGRFLLDDDDEDDLRNMESSFDRIEKEEEYSRRQGLQEDIEDILREEAEKKRRRAQIKKRPKTAA